MIGNKLDGLRGTLADYGQALWKRLTVRLSPLARGFAAGLVYGAGAFLLAALPLLDRPLPLGACLVVCAGLWSRSLGALAGACGGYALLWGWEAAMEPLALSLSFFAAAVIFRRTPVALGLLSAGLNAAVGAVFLLDTGVTPLALLHLGVGTALAGLGPGLYRRAMEGAPGAGIGAGALLLLSLGNLLPPWGTLGALCAALMSSLQREATGGGAKPRPPIQSSLPSQRGVERALKTMYGILSREDPLLQPLQLAEVYDFAAEQVCRCCVYNALCWEQEAEQTYRDLCAAGESILHRGTALREDFPRRFTDRCRHTEGFLTAVNQALDEVLVQRREALRRQESRRVAAEQYLALERLLRALTCPLPKGPLCYTPELAVGSACRGGNQVSGDRGATCRDRFGNFYVLLCDGMGTGPAARGESDRAARLLTAFLETGMEADGALGLLNGFYVLRKSSAFATLDLLKLDLRTGQGCLYKWGAAPSFLRRGGQVEKIGTVIPPPGLAAGEGGGPGQYGLSLREGETLVMVSDGAYGEETAQRLTEFDQGTVRDLASCLITLGQADPEDDRTTVVIRLKALGAA